ncbi:MAG TPA: hypothetical protein VEK06_01305 [Myxococcota bacterium]|nr:hypothetical protein [Myxococcota bacterium]
MKRGEPVAKTHRDMHPLRSIVLESHIPIYHWSAAIVSAHLLPAQHIIVGLNAWLIQRALNVNNVGSVIAALDGNSAAVLTLVLFPADKSLVGNKKSSSYVS